MENILVRDLLALSLYVIFMGFCFCDGFGLHTSRKIVWFLVLLIISAYSLRTRATFDLGFILPIPTLLALFLCIDEKRRKQRQK